MFWRWWYLLWMAAFQYLVKHTLGGFGDPSVARRLLQPQTGNPCDCRTGTENAIPNWGQGSDGVIRDPLLAAIDCGSKTPSQVVGTSGSGSCSMNYFCVSKPQIIPVADGRLGLYPCTTFYDSMHSSCYSSVQP